MTIKEIVTVIASKEGKLKEVSVGNIREIVGIVSDLMISDFKITAALIKNGSARAARRKKK